MSGTHTPDDAKPVGTSGGAAPGDFVAMCNNNDSESDSMVRERTVKDMFGRIFAGEPEPVSDDSDDGSDDDSDERPLPYTDEWEAQR